MSPLTCPLPLPLPLRFRLEEEWVSFLAVVGILGMVARMRLLRALNAVDLDDYMALAHGAVDLLMQAESASNAQSDSVADEVEAADSERPTMPGSIPASDLSDLFEGVAP